MSHHSKAIHKQPSTIKCNALVTCLSSLCPSGVYSFHPEKLDAEDDERQCLSRVRKLSREIQDFLISIRLAEGFMSPNQIHQGARAQKSHHAALLSDIAKAQAAFNISGSRASRAQAWQNISKLVADSHSPAQTEDPCDGPVSALEHFVSSSMSPDQTERTYQLLLVRLHPCGEIVVALTEKVFRGSITKAGKSKGHKIVRGRLPVQFCVRLQLVLLRPLTAGRITHWQASSRSQAIAVDPHSEEGIVLCQINASHYNIHETSLYLAVTLHAPVQDVMQKLAGTGWVPGAWAIVGLIFRGCLLCLCAAWERLGIAGLPFP